MKPKSFRVYVLMLLALAGIFIGCPMASADDLHCHVALAHDASPAENALLHGNPSEAETLYREALAKTPHDPILSLGLVRALLREQKIDDAESLARAELTTAPNSVPLLTALAEVQFREGKIAEAAGTADQAYRADRCNGRIYLLRARIFRLNSMYASESRALGIAHTLDPFDPEITGAWSRTLSLAKRIDDQKLALAAVDAKDTEAHTRAEKYLEYLESRADTPDKNCHLLSNTTSTEFPLVLLTADGSGRHNQGWGIHVSLNKQEAALEVDSGATGLLITRAVAERAGLQATARIQIGGIGDEGVRSGFTARVDSIRVGSLEFRDCIVSVTDRQDMLNIDGLIGTDVFSSYLVTLDYPMRKLKLSQLPSRPNDNSGPAALNTDAGGQNISSSTAGKDAPSTAPQDRYIDPTMKDYFPVFRSGHYLVLPVVLNGKTQRLFMVDSGAFSSSISTEAAREVTKVHGGSPIRIQGLSGNVAKVSSGDQIIFTFAGIQQANNDLFAFDNPNLSRAAGFEISGLLGNTILRELVTHIDYRDGLIKFDYDPHHGNHDFSH